MLSRKALIDSISTNRGSPTSTDKPLAAAGAALGLSERSRIAGTALGLAGTALGLAGTALGLAAGAAGIAAAPAESGFCIAAIWFFWEL